MTNALTNAAGNLSLYLLVTRQPPTIVAVLLANVNSKFVCVYMCASMFVCLSVCVCVLINTHTVVYVYPA